ncbi:MAG: hypothetical protein FD145_741 [Candidatus Saganbacteria bacterium]|uniref:NAD(P)H-hydrate epimerase n=1 Tax=Candidatus Saganbacteria bacterium TaxID=2575572 RepID=A0A833P021_UNCSA|nr:MAG: hypothetical protein FD145_741 [Candidatus Saganbacteria bacterium]
MKIVTAEEMAELDRHAIYDLKIPSINLMENAGRAAADEAVKITKGKNIAVICGRGNNGGDGFVAARYLAEKGFNVLVILIGNRKDVKKDPKTNIEKLKVPIYEAPDLDSFNKLKNDIENCNLIIDAIFGIGLNSKIKSPYFEIITYLNSLNIPILSIDVPSGLNATDGLVMGAAISADTTITFQFAKTGFYKGEGQTHAGKIVIADIGIPV